VKKSITVIKLLIFALNRPKDKVSEPEPEPEPHHWGSFGMKNDAALVLAPAPALYIHF
jgi:hypothetical protein